jgi:tryptophan synthase alpha chain
MTSLAADRLGACFATLRKEGQAAMIAFITAGDPDHDTSLSLLCGLPRAGVDVIELGMPFTDPVADGPAIEAANLRALRNGANMVRTLDLVRHFRRNDDTTPIILMGYFNPIYAYGAEKFVADAAAAGVDGFIVVDLPLEEIAELENPANTAGLNVVRLATPTTDDARLETVLAGAKGFVYYVAIAGITGSASADAKSVDIAVTRIRRHTNLPIAVGFGIRTPEQAAAIARVADATVVGSAIVSKLEQNLDDQGMARPELVDQVMEFVSALASGVRQARSAAAE